MTHKETVAYLKIIRLLYITDYLVSQYNADFHYIEFNDVTHRMLLDYMNTILGLLVLEEKEYDNLLTHFYEKIPGQVRLRTGC